MDDAVIPGACLSNQLPTYLWVTHQWGTILSIIASSGQWTFRPNGSFRSIGTSQLTFWRPAPTAQVNAWNDADRSANRPPSKASQPAHLNSIELFCQVEEHWNGWIKFNKRYAANDEELETFSKNNGINDRPTNVRTIFNIVWRWFNLTLVFARANVFLS